MSKPIDKTNILNYLKEHYSEFKNKYNVEQIGLFGSYARDEATESSDIDIFVKMKPSLFDMVAIKEQIENDLERVMSNLAYANEYRKSNNLNCSIMKFQIQYGVFYAIINRYN